MKTISKILIILIFIAFFSGCEKDNDNPSTPDNNPLSSYIHTAQYKLIFNGETLKEGSCNSISVYPEAETNHSLVMFSGKIIDFAGSNAVAGITGIPYSVGEEAEININEISIVFLHLGNEDKTFMATSGIIKREANNKITFRGQGTIGSEESKIFSGYVTSKAIELIKE